MVRAAADRIDVEGEQVLQSDRARRPLSRWSGRPAAVTTKRVNGNCSRTAQGGRSHGGQGGRRHGGSGRGGRGDACAAGPGTRSGSVRSSFPCWRWGWAARSRLRVPGYLAPRLFSGRAGWKRVSSARAGTAPTSCCSAPPWSPGPSSPPSQRGGRSSRRAGRCCSRAGSARSSSTTGAAGRCSRSPGSTAARRGPGPGSGGATPPFTRGQASASSCAPSSAPTSDPTRGDSSTRELRRGRAACPPRVGWCLARSCLSRRPRAWRPLAHRAARGVSAGGRGVGWAMPTLRRSSARSPPVFAPSSAPDGRSASPGAASRTC